MGPAGRGGREKERGEKETERKRGKKESAAGVSLTPRRRRRRRRRRRGRRGRGRGRRRYCVPLECLSRGELEGPGPRRNKDLLSHTQPSPWGHGSLTRANREIRDRAENHGPFESCARSIALSFLSLVPIPPLLPHFYFSRGRFEWRSESERKCAEPKGNKEERRERERGKREISPICCEKRAIDSRCSTFLFRSRK